jgi:homogentisate 1,2-dioxygenase
MNAFIGLVHRVNDAKAEGFLSGGASLHNCMSAARGPDRATFEWRTRPSVMESTLPDAIRPRSD